MSSQLPLARSAAVLLAALALGCQAGRSGNSSADGRGAQLVFERLQIGSVYGIGSRFESDDLEFAVEGFGQGLGNVEIAEASPAPGTPAARGASATRSETASAKREEKEERGAKAIRLAHATLRCAGAEADRLEFDFVDHCGPVALEIAGSRRGAEDFVQLDGAEQAGVTIAVRESSTAGVRHGRVTLTGRIAGFAISGADLEVADLRLAND